MIPNPDTKAVFPNTTNHYATLFGGTALQEYFTRSILRQDQIGNGTAPHWPEESYLVSGPRAAARPASQPVEKAACRL